MPLVGARWLVLADALCILVFTCIGMLSHDRGITGNGIARDTVPLLGAWLGAALLLRTYRRPSVARLLATWAVGIPAGVLVRALVLGRDLDGGQAAFLLTTLGFSALLIGGARLGLGTARDPSAAGRRATGS